MLVLGGTRFAGRHIVERFARRGHRVIAFHRGKTVATLPDGVEERFGDRDRDLSVLASETWDAIVDTSGYVAAQVERSLLLAAKRYLFISTVNVYKDLSASGVSEDAPAIADFDPADAAVSYGGNKAACERLVRQRYPHSSVILRPGLIVGRWDPSGRFTYWCERAARGGAVLAPGDPQRRIQFIDAADLAAFAEHALANDVAGTFNVAGPALPATMSDLLEACARAAVERGAIPSHFVWANAAFLHEHGVQEWSEMPLWIGDPAFGGMLEIDNARALAAGLRPRPMMQTVRSVLSWIDAGSDVKLLGISAEREAELLERLRRGIAATS